MNAPKPACKAYRMDGDDGFSLVISETPERTAIEVSIHRLGENAGQRHVEVARTRISAAQFEILCRLDSAYGNGLEVFAARENEPEVVGAAVAVLEREERDAGGEI